jgi:hypothetical protein
MEEVQVGWSSLGLPVPPCLFCKVHCSACLPLPALSGDVEVMGGCGRLEVWSLHDLPALGVCLYYSFVLEAFCDAHLF